PSLPANSDFDFEPSEGLTLVLQEDLERNLTRYIEYLDKIGLSRREEKAKIKIDELDPANAHYNSETRTLTIDSRIANDPFVALREYGHHVLFGDRLKDSSQDHDGIESGLADYFPGSFLDDPILGRKSARLIGFRRSYVRRLDNKKQFEESMMGVYERRHDLGEIWGGAFWELRKRLGKDAIDPILAKAWRSSDPSTQAFLEAFLAEIRVSHVDKMENVYQVFAERKFPVPPSQKTSGATP